MVSFEPAFSPTTTKSVFFETEPEAFPPRVMIASFAPSRVKPSSPPVTTTVRPSRVFTKPSSTSSAIRTPEAAQPSTISRCQSVSNHSTTASAMI